MSSNSRLREVLTPDQVLSGEVSLRPQGATRLERQPTTIVRWDVWTNPSPKTTNVVVHPQLPWPCITAVQVMLAETLALHNEHQPVVHTRLDDEELDRFSFDASSHLGDFTAADLVIAALRTNELPVRSVLPPEFEGIAINL